MRRFDLLILPLALCALASCTTPDVRSDARGAVVTPWFDELPIAAPWLREQLPDGAMAYARMPHPLGAMAMPKGNLLDTALGSEANISNVLGIQAGLTEMLIAAAGPEAGPALQFLLEKLRSPIELAGSAMPSPWVMAGMTLDVDTSAELENLLRQVSQTMPLPALTGPIDANGYAQLQGGTPVFLHFDEDSGRLALYGGLNASREAFASLREQSDATAAHPMHSFEAQIDDSGYGYFAWVDTTMVLGLAPLFAPPELMQILRATSADRIQALALGGGVANGKGRMKLIADVGTDRSRRPLPVVENEIAATTVGDPKALFVLSIPTPDEFARLEALALSSLPPQAAVQWQGAKDALAARAGVAIEDILAAIGPELLSFSDAAGDFLGMRVRDHARLDDILDRLATASGTPIGERTVDGQTIRYISLPGTLGMPGSSPVAQAAPIFDMLSRMRSRMYWIHDGDYLYVAGIPQLLIDRGHMGADTPIANWLDETQRIDLSASMLAMTGSVQNLPRMTYQMYLGMMQALSDLVDVEYDIWSMPTMTDLGLPDRGTLGAAINLGEPQISLELTYESHPAEALLAGGGMAGVAAAGVMAAIAIPAYQDYTIRAQVSEGLNLAARAKQAVVETYAATGAVPVDLAAAGLDPVRTAISGRYVHSVAIEDGQIVITYGGQSNPLLAGRVVVLTPYAVPSGAVFWICGYAQAPAPIERISGTGAGPTDLEPKYLPQACRSGSGAPIPVASGVPVAAVF